MLMPILLGSVLLTVLLELLLYGPLWRWRKTGAAIIIMLLPGLSAAVFMLRPSWFTGLVLLLAAARVFNLLRVVQGRMHEDYLHRVTRRTGHYFAGTQGAVAGGLLIVPEPLMGLKPAGWLLLFFQLAVSAILLFLILRNLHKTRFVSTEAHYSDRELPSVTVAIPARNETEDLQDCLRSLLANDYPKLEIIVLDDCSRDRTPEIIKDFAHDGVRFIKGREPDESWLAKNLAYARLADAASGDYILFCGVDTRFGPHAIKEAVRTIMNRRKAMLSVLPRRIRHGGHATLVQPMRYWWQLALPRRLFNRPAVLSTCWLIKADVLRGLGGFAAVKRSIIPEVYFARELVKSNEYAFIRAGQQLDVTTEKAPAEQIATAIRVRYPQIRRRPELALPLALAELLFLLGPFIALAYSVATRQWAAAAVSLLAALLLMAGQFSIAKATNPSHALQAAITFPAAVLTEICLGLTSMVRYEFFSVTWKDRNICLPVMHVVPHLPNPDKH